MILPALMWLNAKLHLLMKINTLLHLAACDGIRSSIRDAFFAANQDPKYSGYSAWRGIGKSNLQKIHFALGPDSHIVSYPINKEGDVSFVAVRKEDYQFKESWKKKRDLF